MNTFSKLYLALLGLFPWDYVPTIPCEVILIGKWFYVNFNEMSSWSRSMLVPLAIINHFKPTRELKKTINLNELYPEGMHERDLALAPDPERITWRNFFLWLDRVHKFAEWFAQNRIHPFRRRALRKAPRTGRPPQLTDAEKKRLVVALEAGALVQGYATDLWTLSRVGKLIEKISGKRYSESGVWRLLKGLNFSCQRPSGRAIKRDEQAIRHWKTKRWPTLKKTAPNKAEPSSS